jgi:hypothetical protein
MKPGLCPANRQSTESTKPTMAQARGKRADRRMLAVDWSTAGFQVVKIL